MPVVNNFHEKVLSAIHNYDMLDNVGTVIIALSGGADSVSLLHFFYTNSKELNINVRAAHVNHNLRGAESKRDEAFVRKLCEELHIPLDVLNVDIASEAAERNIGLEECGRIVRYDFFKKLTDKFTDSVTATAHTASDNAETIILNMTRGCGLHGLCGIPPKREGIIRPLINCMRSDIESYCEELKLNYVTDSTNLQDDYCRNKIRLNVSPQLRSINPSFEYALNRLSLLAKEDSEIIDKYAEIKRKEALVENNALDVNRLIECGRALSSHIIRIQLEKSFGINCEKRHIDLIASIMTNAGGAVEIRKNKRVRIENDLLLFETDYLSDKYNMNDRFEISLKAGNKFEFNGKHYEISDKINVNCKENCKINKKLLIDRISCGIISDDTKIRTRKSGDTFTQFGRGCTKTVKKLFSELKLDKEDRDTRLLAANGNEVLWIEGIGVSQSAAALYGDYLQIRAGVLLMDKKLSKILIDQNAINDIVSRLAAEINHDYEGREILLVGLLKGCFVFMSDLMRKITVPCKIDFMIVSSYGSGTQSSGKVDIIRDLSNDIKGIDVLIVEDIVDSGITLDCVMDILRNREPASLKLCSFLSKPSRRKRNITIDYCGTEIEDEFVVGYGLDYAERFRELPFVGVLSE